MKSSRSEHLNDFANVEHMGFASIYVQTLSLFAGKPISAYNFYYPFELNFLKKVMHFTSLQVSIR